MSYLAIIPARGGSKGLPRKNVLEFGGKPLIAWSIDAALACLPSSHVIVSTDCIEIAEIAQKYGASVPFIRPQELACDNTPTEPVMMHALNFVSEMGLPDLDAVILLQPTSPVRLDSSLSRAILQFENEKADSLLSVCHDHHFYWNDISSPKASYDIDRRPRRQDILPKNQNYRENGSIYITKTNLFRRNLNRLGGKISMFIMTQEESWEIDSPLDFRVAKTFLESIIANDH